MKTSQRFVSLITNGKIPKVIFDNIMAFVGAHEGQTVVITIDKWRKQRSNNQNAFWWSVIIPMVRMWLMDQGIVFDAEMTHEFLVRHVWKHTEVVVMPDGCHYEKRKSSTQLTTEEWSRYLDITYSYFSEKGLVLPPPEKNLEPPEWMRS